MKVSELQGVPLSAEGKVFLGFVLLCVYARPRFSDAAKARSEPFLGLTREKASWRPPPRENGRSRASL